MGVQTQLAYLRSKLGETEKPPFSNHTPEWDIYSKNTGAPSYQGSFWCGALVVNGLYAGGFRCPANWISVRMIRLWAQAHGRWKTDLHQAQPGDVLCFKGDEHTETVEVNLGGGHVQTIGGNTSNHGYNPNGGGTYRNVRSGDVVAGFAVVHDITNGHADEPVSHVPPHPVVNPGPLQVTGVMDTKTWMALQTALGVKADGDPGKITFRALQLFLKVRADGVIGPITIKALQKYVGAVADGVWGKETTKAVQLALNHHHF